MREWQVKLREEAALNEAFVITRQSDGSFAVKNYASDHSYAVTWIREGHQLNSCSCMDFRTSGLQTCKHLEAVKNFIRDKRVRKMVRQPETVLYVDYSDVPRIRIFFDGENADNFRAVAGEIFDNDGYADPESPAFTRIRLFIQEALSLGCFRCTPDAVEFIDRYFDNQFRNSRLDTIFKDDSWWKKYLVTGIVPYKYQIEGMEFAARNGRCLIADEMGLGKTIQAIATASLLYNEGYVDSVLIVCPTSLKYQWQKEIKKFCGKESVVVEGVHTQRCRMYKEDCLFKIVSYNALANDLKVLKELSVDMVIMDEVQRLKNWNTQIAKGMRRIRSDYRIILSGTPLENKLEELYSVVQIADTVHFRCIPRVQGTVYHD